PGDPPGTHPRPFDPGAPAAEPRDRGAGRRPRRGRSRRPPRDRGGGAGASHLGAALGLPRGEGRPLARAAGVAGPARMKRAYWIAIVVAVAGGALYAGFRLRDVLSRGPVPSAEEIHSLT